MWKTSHASTPHVYSNQRFRYLTTPDPNTYCVCSSAVTYFPTKSNKGICSTPTPKCTSDSFFSLQTPHTTEQVNKIQGRHTATNHKGSNTTSSKCGYCFQCPRWHCSSVRFGTIDTTPLSRCLNWKTRFQVSNTQPSLKGCWNNSELLWYTNHLVTKRQKHFQKFSSQIGSRPNASNQLAGVTSLYQTSRLVTRLVKNEMIHSNSFTKSSCNTEQHGNLMFHFQNSSSLRDVFS